MRHCPNVAALQLGFPLRYDAKHRHPSGKLGIPISNPHTKLIFDTYLIWWKSSLESIAGLRQESVNDRIGPKLPFRF